MLNRATSRNEEAAVTALGLCIRGDDLLEGFQRSSIRVGGNADRCAEDRDEGRNS